MGEEQGTVSETNRQVLPQFPKSELEMWKILSSFMQLVRPCKQEPPGQQYTFTLLSEEL